MTSASHICGSSDLCCLSSHICANDPRKVTAVEYIQQATMTIQQATMTYGAHHMSTSVCSSTAACRNCPFLESALIKRIYSFYDEFKHRYNIKMWKQFCDVFKTFIVCGFSSMRRLCACTAAYRPISATWTRSAGSCAPPTCEA